jgi:uncharacterized protein YbjT (DUF2867 family)
MGKNILVIGGTGMLGTPVAKRLKEEGFNVRILARSVEKAASILGEGYEFIKGDYEDADSLRTAMSNCDGVHISIKGGPSEADFDRADHLGVKRIANTAKATGVKHVTLTSAYAVSDEKADTPESKSKVKGEAALKACGVNYTIFRCSWFMESIPLFVQGNSISLIGDQKHPLHWVAAEDYARMVSKNYLLDENINRELYIFGPEAYTMRQAMEIYISRAARHLKVSPISTKMLSTLGTLPFNSEWKSMATLMKHYEKYGEDGSPEEANRLLGAPQLTLQKWCEQFSHR